MEVHAPGATSGRAVAESFRIVFSGSLRAPRRLSGHWWPRLDAQGDVVANALAVITPAPALL